MQARIEALMSEVAALPRARKLLLLLDYDGTLVEIASRPELARPTPDLIRIISRLLAAPDLTVMLVSGRPLADLRSLLPIPGLNYLGSHGAEGLIEDNPFILTTYCDCGEEREDLRQQLFRCLGELPGWWLETKPCGFALHYRQATLEAERAIMAALEPWLEEVNRSSRHQLLCGTKTVEILPIGVSKGAAIRGISVLPGFLEHFPIYLGDDVTDETAFQALQGRGLTIKVGGDPLVSAATYVLSAPSEVLQFLSLLAAYRT
jgi:trehalose 6-phosphate phosphatase